MREREIFREGLFTWCPLNFISLQLKKKIKVQTFPGQGDIPDLGIPQSKCTLKHMADN